MVTADRPERHTRSLIVYAVLLLAGVAYFGVDRTLSLMAGGLTIVFLIFFGRHLSFAIAAARWAENDLLAADVEVDGFTPSVAVFVSCKNEELVVDGMVRALLSLEYPADKLRIMIVDDGSTDLTGAKLDAWAEGDERLEVLHRAPGAGGGKSGALNDALAVVDSEIAVVFDADHEPARNVIRRLVRHFRDPEVGCVMGRCIVRNGEESPLAGIIFIDFLSGYLVNEYGRQALFELPAYGGANCAVRISTLRELGGWNPHTVTEDTDLTLRVVLAGMRVRFDPSAIDFEEAVVSARRFWKQRYRWARGHQQCLRDYWRPMMTTRHLSLIEKLESAMFLCVYHVPVLCGLGVVLTVLRTMGIGGKPAIGFLPLSMLLFVGPLTELAVGLLLARVERRTAWHLIGFLPSFALSIVSTTRAYFDGIFGRPYLWVKTARTGATSTQATPLVPARSQIAAESPGLAAGASPAVVRSRNAVHAVAERQALRTAGLLIRSGSGPTRRVGAPPRSFARHA
jgi:cellulose synthase/poly-beta-1,6-N-acetylglucosamine synthase-like glycosyltransferase